MEQKNQILGNQLVVMSREDLNSLVNEMAQNIVAAQKAVQGTNSEWISLPDGDRFITREEASKLLHVDYSTLWRWNKLGLLVSRKVGPRRVVYKYSDVLRRLNVEHKTEQKGEGHDGGMLRLSCCSRSSGRQYLILQMNRLGSFSNPCMPMPTRAHYPTLKVP